MYLIRENLTPESAFIFSPGAPPLDPAPDRRSRWPSILLMSAANANILNAFGRGRDPQSTSRARRTKMSRLTFPRVGLLLRPRPASERGASRMHRGRKIAVIVSLGFLALCSAGSYMTRGVMEHLPFLHGQK